MNASASLAVCLLCVACSPGAPLLPDLGPARAFSEEIATENLMPVVERLAADHLADDKLDCAGFETKEKYPACELTSTAAVAFVHDTLSALGFDTRVVVQGKEPFAAHNVVAEQRGTSAPNEVVLVGAHLDAFYAGADDNCSGVAVMLELARIAAAHRFARSVRFVGFDLEERGAAGSTRYVEAGMADDVTAALILEAVGYTDERAGSQSSPPGLELGDVGDSLAIAANEDSVDLAQTFLAVNHELGFVKLRAVISGGSGAFPFTGALLRSDNGAFWLRGVPALMLTDTADYRNPDYHEAGDTPDKLDPEFLAGVARAVAALLAVLAEIEP